MPIPEHPSLSLMLKVNIVLPAAYPRAAPKIHLDLDKAVHKFYEDSMNDTVDELVAEMLKEKKQQIVFDVLSVLQQELDKAASNKAEGAKIPSLEEHRALQAAKLESKRAKEQAEKEQEEKQKQEAEKAKNKTLAKNARLEALQSTPKAPKVTFSETTAPRDSLVQDFTSDFGKILKMDDINHVERETRKIKQHQFYARGPVSDCYKVVPDIGVLPSEFLVVKRSRIKAPAPGTGDGVTLDTLDESVRNAITIAQGSDKLMQIHAFEIKAAKEEGIDWVLEILMDHGSMGSLRQFIVSAQELTSNRACELGLEVLSGLAYLHDNGVVHRDLHADNILLVKTVNGSVQAKISDIIFQDTVHRMTGVPSCNQRWDENTRSWAPPELLDGNVRAYSEKTDIWNYGIILLQMLFGLDFMAVFAHVDSILYDRGSASPSLKEVLKKIFHRKPKHRPRATDLTNYSYFTDNNASSDSPQRRNSSVYEAHPNLASDRFAQEFVVMEKLGQGAFGEVLKARKRLDGQEYAVKRIKESDDMTFDEIVREVKSLSSLQSMYIVRYYNAWIQKVPHSAGASSLTDDEVDSDISKTIPYRSKTQTSQFGQSTGLSQSLDWVAKKSPLSRRLTSEDLIEEESETEDEDESDSDQNDDSDDSNEDGEEEEDEADDHDDDQEESYHPTGYTNIEFDSNPFGLDSHGVHGSQSNVDTNEHAIADSDEDGDTDLDHNNAGSRVLYIQ